VLRTRPCRCAVWTVAVDRHVHDELPMLATAPPEDPGPAPATVHGGPGHACSADDAPGRDPAPGVARPGRHHLAAGRRTENHALAARFLRPGLRFTQGEKVCRACSSGFLRPAPGKPAT
jgi:hypothetical protein